MSSFSHWYNSIFHTLYAPRPAWRIHNPRAQPRPPRASFFPGSPSPSSRVTWLGAEVSYGVKASKPGYSITRRAAGMDFWNKRRGFLTPIVAKVHQSGPWGRAVDGWPWRAAGMDFWNKRHGFLVPIVAEVRQTGPWTAGRDGPPGRTFETNGTDSWRRLLQKFVRAGRGRLAVTGRRDGLLKQTAQIPGAECCRSSSERAVGAGRGRPAVTGCWDELLKQTARIPGADCCRSSSERAVDGWPWRPLGWTFETNGTDSWRRLLQKFVRAGRGRLAVTGRRDGLLKQTARIPGADCCRSSSERAVDGWPWRAALMDFWNKRHGFLAPIVAEVRQSGPWTAGRDGPPGWTFETNGTDSWRRLLQKFVRAGRGRPAVTGCWDELLKQTARIPGADCCRSSSERAVGAGRGRPVETDCWDQLLKQTARIPGADCFKSRSDRAVHVNQAYHVYFPEPHWNSMGLPEITIW